MKDKSEPVELGTPFYSVENKEGASVLVRNPEVSMDDYLRAILKENNGEWPAFWIGVLGQKKAAALKNQFAKESPKD